MRGAQENQGKGTAGSFSGPGLGVAQRFSAAIQVDPSERL